MLPGKRLKYTSPAHCATGQHAPRTLAFGDNSLKGSDVLEGTYCEAELGYYEAHESSGTVASNKAEHVWKLCFGIPVVSNPFGSQ